MKRLIVAFVAAISCAGLLASGASAAPYGGVTLKILNSTGHRLLLDSVQSSPRVSWDKEAPKAIEVGQTAEFGGVAENGMDFQVVYTDMDAPAMASIYTRHSFKLGGSTHPALAGFWDEKRIAESKGSSVRVEVQWTLSTLKGLLIFAEVTRR